MARPAAAAAGKPPHIYSKLLPGEPRRHSIEHACDHGGRACGSVTSAPLNEPDRSNKRAKGGGRTPTCGFAPTAGLSVCLSIGSVGNFCARMFDGQRRARLPHCHSHSNGCADRGLRIDDHPALQQTTVQI